MEYRDYYKTLGVGKSADAKEIKSAYRKLARKYHPDVNHDDPQAESRLKEINEAYEVLSNSEKRSMYDRLGANWQRYQQSGQPGNFNWDQWANQAGGPRVRVQYPDDMGDVFGGGGQFSDFFSTIFGGGGTPGTRRSRSYEHGSQPRAGRNIEQEVEISLTEAYLGTSRRLNKDGRRMEVKIPAGAKTGTKVRVRGEGYKGTGSGKAGNLYLNVKVASDPRFELKDENLYTTVQIDLYTAILGGTIPVPTLAGEVNLKIPAGSQNGQTIRLRGKGMTKLRKPDQHGDLYVNLDVQLPTALTPEQRDLFQELRDLSQ